MSAINRRDIEGERKMDGFAEAMILLKLATDPEATKARLSELKAAETAAALREEAATQAEVSLAKQKAEQEAAIAKERQELDAFHDSLIKRERAASDKLERATSYLRDMQRLDEQMRRAVMNYGGLLANFSDRLQEVPNWQALDKILLGVADAHMDGNDAVTARDEAGDNELPADLVAGSSLTRRNPRPPKPSRSDIIRGS
jgi:hypothetical protein